MSAVPPTVKLVVTFDVAAVKIPVIFPFLASNSSNLKSSPTYRSPPTKRSFPNVVIPINDETPAIFSCFANYVGAVTVVIPFMVVKPSIVTASLKKDSPKKVETPVIPSTSPTES